MLDPIEVTKPLNEAFTWRAVYEDGQTCIDENGVNNFASADLPRVKHLILIPLDEGHSPHIVAIPSDATPIFFRRRKIALSLTDASENNQPTIHCIGWKRDETASYLFVLDNGSSLLTDDLQAV